MATVADILSHAFRLLGVEASGETLDDQFYTDGIYTLNTILYQWSADGLLPVTTTETEHTLTADDGNYTIGSGGDIDTTRPTRVLSAYIASGDTDYPVQVIAEKDYDNIGDKTISGIPFRLYYDASYPLGTVYLWPVPSTTYVLHLTHVKEFAAYLAKTDAISLPNEYLSALGYEAALNIAPEFQLQPSQIVVAMAQKYKETIRSLHSRPVRTINTNPLRSNRDFDITTGY